jgi:hypothetical protein
MKRLKKTTVKMNLCLDKDFYELLQDKAKNDYVKVATWTKQYLMKCLLEKNNSESKCLTQNGNRMGL